MPKQKMTNEEKIAKSKQQTTRLEVQGLIVDLVRANKAMDWESVRQAAHAIWLKAEAYAASEQ